MDAQQQNFLIHRTGKQRSKHRNCVHSLELHQNELLRDESLGFDVLELHDDVQNCPQAEPEFVHLFLVPDDWLEKEGQWRVELAFDPEFLVPDDWLEKEG